MHVTITTDTDGTCSIPTLGTEHNLTFLRVYRAGHMVPRDQPAHALAMLNAFLDNSL